MHFLQKSMHKYDENRNGVLELSEARLFIQDLVRNLYDEPQYNLDLFTFQQIFKRFDSNGDKVIQAEELKSMV